jgi:hypothetical protein
MPEGELSDDLILAALERAELHGGRDEPGVLYASVVAHLGLKMGPKTGWWMRPRFRAVEAAGLVRSWKRLGMIFYTATPKGRKLLNTARRSGALGVLPESPQHRVWRESRESAAESIGGFRGELRALLDEASSLLADEGTASEPWFVLGVDLQRACSRLAAATHCLHEWAEPDEASADVDDHPRRGRRNMRLWS